MTHHIFISTAVLAALVLGGILGYFIRQIVARFQKRSLETNVKEIMLRAREDATRIVEESERRALSREDEFKKMRDFLLNKEKTLL